MFYISDNELEEIYSDKKLECVNNKKKKIKNK